MKTLTLTMLQAVRIAIMLDNHQGQRRELRIVRDIRERLGLPDEKLAAVTTPVQNGVAISAAVKDMDDIQIQLAPEEARKLLEILDSQTLTTRDLQWAEPLAKELAN